MTQGSRQVSHAGSCATKARILNKNGRVGKQVQVELAIQRQFEVAVPGDSGFDVRTKSVEVAEVDVRHQRRDEKRRDRHDPCSQFEES